MKLLFTVLFLGESRLEATVQDHEGHRRRINFNWIEKAQSDVPPAHWTEAVAGEVEYQRSQDNDRASGRVLPNY